MILPSAVIGYIHWLMENNYVAKKKNTVLMCVHSHVQKKDKAG